MKKDEQANVLLSLKNLYRLFTVKDYPVYSTGILGEKSKKGLTLVRFWDEYLPNLSSFSGAWGATLYAGVMSCGVAYTLQIVGQKNINPTVASLILSLESCISVLAGWIILGQKLSTREIIGCVVMFGAIVLAQLPQKETASEK